MAIEKSFRSLGVWAKRGATVAAFGVIGVMLAACGGSGAAGGDPGKSGTLALQPSTGTLYANVTYKFNVLGGRAPYVVTSNEQTLVPLNRTVNGNDFEVTPNQTGIVDLGQAPEQLPTRKVNIEVRDSNGSLVSAAYDVAQNFLTGYTLSVSSLSSCGTTGTTTPAACSGFESVIQLRPVTNGLRSPNRQFTFTPLYGPFAFLDVGGNTTPAGSSINVTSDTTGTLTARLKPNAGVPTQYAQFRLKDVPTGAYLDYTFVILGSNIALSVAPSTVNLTGPNGSTCGSGSFDVAIFGGTPPYKVQAAGALDGTVSVTPTVINTNDPKVVRVTVATVPIPSRCPNGAAVIVEDAQGIRATVTINSTVGTTPTPPALVLSGAITCLADGQTSAVLVQGGSPNGGIANSSNASLLSVAGAFGGSPTTITVTAVGTAGAAVVPVTVSATDGATNSSVTVGRKTTCP